MTLTYRGVPSFFLLLLSNPGYASFTRISCLRKRRDLYPVQNWRGRGFEGDLGDGWRTRGTSTARLNSISGWITLLSAPQSATVAESRFPLYDWESRAVVVFFLLGGSSSTETPKELSKPQRFRLFQYWSRSEHAIRVLRLLPGIHIFGGSDFVPLNLSDSSNLKRCLSSVVNPYVSPATRCCIFARLDAYYWVLRTQN